MEMHNILGMSRVEEPFDINSSIFKSTSYIGVEVEVERTPNSVFTSLPSWSRVSEGSIDGWEAVLRRPMRTHELFLALNEFNDVSFNRGAFTERTSVHIHVDIRDMTFDQFMNFLTLSTMFEAVLYKYVASHRSHNHFCWSLLDCQSTLHRIASICRANRNSENLNSAIRNNFNADSTKYAGINLSSVPRYGSLEFRMHEGTANSTSLIRWINILMSIKEYAMGEGRTPLNILETKQSLGIDSIFTAVLGDYKGILTYEGVDKDILQGIRSAQDFVYVINNDLQDATPPTIETSLYTDFLSTINNRYLSDQARRLVNA
jgi:hypothetical protein